MTRTIPLYTLDGVGDCAVSDHPFATDDGLGLALHRFTTDPDADASVLIIHGLTTSTDMFIMPEHENLVNHLHGHGYSDVWCLDFRMSNRFPYNLWRHRYSMDEIALFDFPPAVAKIREHIGDRPLHVICHCLGAVSFTMSLFGGAVDGITSVIANSVALTPRVPKWSKLKLRMAPTLIDRVLDIPYIDPRWSEDPTITRGRVLSKLVSAAHRECDVPACHMLSLMWGTGWPALYRHENLDPVTHERGGDLYGATSMHYYRHVSKMVAAGSRAVKYDPSDERLRSLPDDYLAGAAAVTTPVLFVTGEENRVFTDSNIVCHRQLAAMGADHHELMVVPGYGHQDIFMGKHVSRDVFPGFVDFLDRQAGSPAVARQSSPVGAGRATAD